MKILVVSSNYPRWKGDSTTPFVHNFAKQLVELGHQVRVIAPHYEGALKKETMDDVEIRRFQYLLPQSAQTVCYQGGALGNLEKNTSNKYKLPFLLIFEWLSILVQTLIWRPNVINSHWLVPQSFLCSIVSIVTRTKHVATVHGGDVFALNSGIMKKVKTFAIKQAHRVSVNSSVTEQKVLDLAPKVDDKLFRLPTGILPLPHINSEDVKTLRAKLCQSTTQKLVLFVGRLSEEKGVGDAILAIKRLIDKGLDVRLVIAGEGHDKQKFIDLVKQHHLTEHVQFEGWVDSNQIYTYFKSSDVFVGPSKQSSTGWIEAQGLTFVEAMLAECAVIGTRSGGIPDAVQPGKTGWLCEPNNAEDLSKTIENVLFHQDNVPDIIQNARKFAVENYLVEHVARKFISSINIGKVDD
ncbi:glycosyltransferase family 4 protein [Aliiglaciecola sp. 3_MG-2023]|uniref:glycosyltransferase family 4 protein n=1 Tax=Aliiglaciecola sp. 3_MG-2023 TaxID=3062644 RepID=UPI0026E31AE2|nr:glycosyltransferase family 4 protein [Aliiglaciecola sp. 3_MG-2023]MDO6691861.1 glycosyltransferase family 4 protein [Aliiglaciecola sp. 3_MG-2023]